MKFKLVEATESKICCICKKPFDGYGNNAEPVCSGSCCDECNINEVIPARMKMLDDSSSKDLDEAALNETDESGNDEVDANCEDCGAVVTISVDHEGSAYCANCMKNHLHEALEDYKITYYLSTATAERRPETIEDVENDWKEEVFAADSDYDALLYALELIDSGYDDTDFSTAEEIVEYFEEKDLGDGSAFVVKLEGPNGVIYDMGQTKDDFIEQVKENDEMLDYYRGVLGIDESLEESLRNPKPSMFKRLCKSSDKALCQKACEIMYDWYSNEDAFDDFDSISDFLDYVSSDIYDMLDAATDEEEKNIVLAALNPSKDSDKYVKFIEENFDTLLANLEALDINDLIENNSLDEIAEQLAFMYHKYMNHGVTEPYEESKFEIAFKKYLNNRSINESLTEAIDPSKAFEVKKNSDADVIFYGWQYKNEEPVEIDPEELTYEEYQNRKNHIVSDYNKLYADKPQANRYAKEHDFIFYALYNRKNEELNEGRFDPYFTPYGYRAAAKVLNRTAPEYYWHLKEIEMDRGDGIKLANYALKKGLPVMLDKNSDPDYPEFYLKDGSSEYHWGDYFYTYRFINPDAADLVPYEGNLDILKDEFDDDFTHSISVHDSIHTYNLDDDIDIDI